MDFMVDNDEKMLSTESEQQDATPAPPTEATVQPAADEKIPVPDDGLGEWPTHGGPLGCLVSIVFGCLVASFFSSPLLQRVQLIQFGKAAPAGWLIFTAIVLVLVITIFFGVIGWKIGKRIFREYAPSERQQRIAERMRQDAEANQA
jgi:hypothetical protein